MSTKFVALCLLQAIVVRATIPAGAVAVRQAAPPGCTEAANLITECENAIVNFDNLPGSEQASCICYNGVSWDPSYFDNAIAACISYAYTADPSDYSTIVNLENFCTKEGPVAGGAATTTAPKPASTVAPATTPKPTVTAAGSTVAAGGDGITACSTVDAAISSCEAATAGFISLDGSVQASCICYNGNSWDPSQFDGPVLSCANYLSTASPTDYSDIVSLESFCTKQGNVRASSAGGSPTAKSQIVFTNSPPTASIGAGSSSSESSTPSTTKSTTKPTPVVVTVIESSSAAATSTKSSGSASFSHEGTVLYLGVSFVLAMLGMCIVL